MLLIAMLVAAVVVLVPGGVRFWQIQNPAVGASLYPWSIRSKKLKKSYTDSVTEDSSLQNHTSHTLRKILHVCWTRNDPLPGGFDVKRCLGSPHFIVNLATVH